MPNTERDIKSRYAQFGDSILKQKKKQKIYISHINVQVVFLIQSIIVWVSIWTAKTSPSSKFWTQVDLAQDFFGQEREFRQGQTRPKLQILKPMHSPVDIKPCFELEYRAQALDLKFKPKFRTQFNLIFFFYIKK